MEYMVFGRERAPTTGQHHVQGYVRFKVNTRAQGVQRAIGIACHVEPAKGNEEQNRTYCIKDGVFTEQGTYDKDAGKQGARSDLKRVVALVQAGKSMREIAMEEPVAVIKFSAGIQGYMNIVRRAPLMREIHTTVLWGETGTGKTHRVRTTFPDAFVVNFGLAHPWDGYSQQDVILLDEFNPGKVTIQDLNTYLDKWSVDLGARYNNRTAYWTKVYICSNQPPEEWYNTLFAKPLVDSLMRRLREPMGLVVQVLDQNQEINLTWWSSTSVTATTTEPAAVSTPSTPASDSRTTSLTTLQLEVRTPRLPVERLPVVHLQRANATVGAPGAVPSFVMRPEPASGADAVGQVDIVVID